MRCHFDAESLGELLQPKYVMVTLDFSPSLLGEPVDRHRKYMIFTNKATLHWAHTEKHQQVFEQWFVANHGVVTRSSRHRCSEALQIMRRLCKLQVTCGPAPAWGGCNLLTCFFGQCSLWFEILN